MKILAVGDPHGDKKVFDIPITKDIDVIFITGDLGESESLRKYYFEYRVKKGINNWKEIMISKEELANIYVEMAKSSYEILKYFCSKKPTFFVWGNLMEVRKENIENAEKKYKLKLIKFEEKIKDLKNLYNLSFKEKEFNGFKIAGIPFFGTMEWIKEFSSNDEKVLELTKKQEPIANEFIKKLKKVDILLTHVAPRGILDEVNSSHVPKNWIGKHAGYNIILNYVKKYQPKLVLCGHIHEAKGYEKLGETEIYNLGSNGDYKIIEV